MLRSLFFDGGVGLAKITLICEQCGGSVELDNTHEFGFCGSCKTKVLIKSDTVINEVTQNITKHVYGHEGKDSDELIADGNKFLEIGDNKKANAKFKQAIDVDPENWEAWFGYASTGGDRTGYISCVPAYRKAYGLATEENQELITFADMAEYLPDSSLSNGFIKAYKTAPPKNKEKIFNLVLGVIGCDESEIAKLAIDLCPDDWRAWLAQAKIRQVRVRWCDKKLSKDATEVLNVFLRSYQLAKSESEEAKNEVLSYIAAMEKDGTYKHFINELKSKIKREG